MEKIPHVLNSIATLFLFCSAANMKTPDVWYTTEKSCFQIKQKYNRDQGEEPWDVIDRNWKRFFKHKEFQNKKQNTRDQVFFCNKWAIMKPQYPVMRKPSSPSDSCRRVSNCQKSKWPLQSDVRIASPFHFAWKLRRQQMTSGPNEPCECEMSPSVLFYFCSREGIQGCSC